MISTDEAAGASTVGAANAVTVANVTTAAAVAIATVSSALAKHNSVHITAHEREILERLQRQLKPLRGGKLPEMHLIAAAVAMIRDPNLSANRACQYCPAGSHGRAKRLLERIDTEGHLVRCVAEQAAAAMCPPPAHARSMACIAPQLMPTKTWMDEHTPGIAEVDLGPLCLSPHGQHATRSIRVRYADRRAELHKWGGDGLKCLWCAGPLFLTALSDPTEKVDANETDDSASDSDTLYDPCLGRIEEKTCDACMLRKRTIATTELRWHCMQSHDCDFSLCMHCARICSTADGWVGDGSEYLCNWNTRIHIKYELPPDAGETADERKARNDVNRRSEERVLRQLAPESDMFTPWEATQYAKVKYGLSCQGIPV